MKDIDFTFGIITDASTAARSRLIDIIISIQNLNIPNFEIIIVGNANNLSDFANHKIIDFNENIKSKWITKKKNIITQNATYDNIVYSHDYILYDKDWYLGWKEFGENYDACMNRIINVDGSRFRDWTIFDDHEFKDAALYSGYNKKTRENLLPYDEAALNRYQYFSGTYWVAKKSIMQEIPQDENLVWGQGEDLVWANSFKRKYKFSMNAKSTVKIHPSQTHHHVIFSEMTPNTLTKVKEYMAIIDRQKL